MFRGLVPEAPQVEEGLTHVGNDIGGGHRAVAELLGREIAAQAVEVNAEHDRFVYVHALAEQTADHTGKHVAAAGGGHAVVRIVIEVDAIFARADEGSCAFEQNRCVRGFHGAGDEAHRVAHDVVGGGAHHAAHFTRVWSQDGGAR